MSNALPTRAEITHSLREALPDWRRHQRCLPGQKCRTEWGEWVDILLEELHDAISFASRSDVQPLHGSRDGTDPHEGQHTSDEHERSEAHVPHQGP